jgi:hypothetical protein
VTDNCGNPITCQACGSDAGNDVTPPPQTCNECLFQQCSGQYTVCQGDPNCQAIYQCATGNPSMATQCYCATPAGEAKYLALASCDSDNQCTACQAQCAAGNPMCPPGTIPPDICSTSDAGMPDAAGPDAPPPPMDCTTCVDTMCATQKAQCAANSPAPDNGDCDKYTQCLAACTDTACSMACDTAHGQGKSDAQALAMCTTTSCAGPCGL